MPLGVCAHRILRPPPLDATVHPDQVVIPDIGPTVGEVPAVHSGGIHIADASGVMDDDLPGRLALSERPTPLVLKLGDVRSKLLPSKVRLSASAAPPVLGVG